jgi:site-specific DNA recombinase
LTRYGDDRNLGEERTEVSTQKAQTKKSAKAPAARDSSPTGMRVALYTRISTDEAHQPYSMEAQADRLRAYASSQENWTVTGLYRDEITGVASERPGLQKALEHARRGRYDLLLVFKVDRLARTVGVLVEILGELERHGVAFRSATEPFDTANPAGRLMVQMLGVIAEFERATIIERVIAGMEKKAAKGGWNGSAPYGYDYDDATAALVPNEAETPIVGRIFEHYVHQLWGSTQIARWLNDAGLRTKRGALWSPNAVRSMLSNRAYVGDVSFRGTVYPGRHAPIIERAVFDRTQQILAERGEDMATRRSHRSLYLLSGRLRCVRCGRSFVGVTANGNGGAYRYYACSSLIKYGKKGCDQERLPAADVERDVIGHILTHLANKNFLTDALDEAQTVLDSERPDRQLELAAIDLEFRKAQATIDRYLRAFEAGSIPEDVCGERLRDLREQAARLADQRGRLSDEVAEPERPSLDAIERLAVELAEALARDDSPRIKDVLRRVIDHIAVESRDKLHPVIRVPLVRIQGDQVGPPGLEPGTNGL